MCAPFKWHVKQLRPLCNPPHPPEKPCFVWNFKICNISIRMEKNPLLRQLIVCLLAENAGKASYADTA